MFSGMLSVKMLESKFFCMSMKIKFSRSELQSVSCKIIRLPSLRVQTCDNTDESDGKLDGIAEGAIERKINGKEDGACDGKLDGITEGKLDGKLIKNIIIHRFLPGLVSSFYEKHPLE